MKITFERNSLNSVLYVIGYWLLEIGRCLFLNQPMSEK